MCAYSRKAEKQAFRLEVSPLSYAGRLELIKSTLSSLHTYWASCFLIPKACLDLLDRHARNFFWGRFDNAKGFNPVSWSNICRPLQQGGLGLVAIRDLAAAAVARQAWSIAAKKNSISFTWANAKYIKDRSFWGLKMPADCSWDWRGILNAHSTSLQGTKDLIGNGCTTLFWHDPWLPVGRLVYYFGHRPLYDLGLSENIEVSFFIQNHCWRFPHAPTQ